MAQFDRPKLRPLSGRRIDHQGRPYVALDDPLGLFTGQVLIPLDLFQQVIRHFDGRNTLAEIQSRVQGETGRATPLADLEALVDKLDRAMVLDGAAYSSFVDQYARQVSRPSSHAGRSYPADGVALRAELARFFANPAGAGSLSIHEPGRPGSIRGILSPHIDFGRGGPVYSHAYKALVERSDADVFVILGVAHQPCRHRFALTRKDFQTPLGLAQTDRGFVDHLADVAGNHLFEDELAHRTEHSIEFQVVFLQYVLGGRRDFTIVPILVGSFHDLMLDGSDPINDPEVGRMIRALRSAEAASGKKVAYIGGIDLCHVGPEFGDPSPVDDATLETIRGFDRAMLDRAASRDSAGWFSEAARVENRWRVCGLAATYTMLEAIGPARGRLLSYDQAVNPSRTCCVTFASVAFEPEPALDDA
jgi:MEMO1 family protein